MTEHYIGVYEFAGATAVTVSPQGGLVNVQLEFPLTNGVSVTAAEARHFAAALIAVADELEDAGEAKTLDDYDEWVQEWTQEQEELRSGDR